MRGAKTLGTLVLVGLLAGCVGPLGPCFGERIEVRLVGSVVAPGKTSRIESLDAVSPSNFEEFDLVRRILIEAEATPRTVIWSAAIFGEPSGGVSVFMPGTVVRGQVFPLQAVQGGGWGTFPFGGQANAQVAFWFDEFLATTVQGTLTVEAVGPLRARLAFTASDSSGAHRTADLTATFAYSRDRTSCT